MQIPIGSFRKLSVVLMLGIFILNGSCFGGNNLKANVKDEVLFQAALECIMKHHVQPILDFMKPSQGDSLFVNFGPYKHEKEKDLAIVFLNKNKNRAVFYQVERIKTGEIIFRNYGYQLKQPDGTWLFNPTDKKTGETFASQGGLETWDEIVKLMDKIMKLKNSKKVKWDKNNIAANQIDYFSTCP